MSSLALINGVMYSPESVLSYARQETDFSGTTGATPFSPPMIPHLSFPLGKVGGRLGHGQHWKRPHSRNSSLKRSIEEDQTTSCVVLFML